MRRVRVLSIVFLGGLLDVCAVASAEPLGPFPQPFCHVVTFDITQNGWMRLKRVDDRREAGGSPTPAIGMTFLNADGSVAIELTGVASMGASPTCVLARISVGKSPAFRFTPSAVIGSGPRPAAVGDGVGTDGPASLVADFNAAADLAAGVELGPGPGASLSRSGADRQEHFRDIDGDEVLAQMARMPIREWNEQDATIRHMGPTPQDFHAAFRLGGDPLTISSIDADGVAFRAIQALEARTRTQHEQMLEDTQSLADQNDSLVRENAERITEIATLKAEIAALRAAMAAPRAAPRWASSSCTGAR